MTWKLSFQLISNFNYTKYFYFKQNPHFHNDHEFLRWGFRNGFSNGLLKLSHNASEVLVGKRGREGERARKDKYNLLRVFNSWIKGERVDEKRGRERERERRGRVSNKN